MTFDRDSPDRRPWLLIAALVIVAAVLVTLATDTPGVGYEMLRGRP